MRKIIILLLFYTLLAGATAWAGQYESARSLGMARGFTALARNYQTLGINPANLALDRQNGLMMELFSAGAVIANNSFSWSDYGDYNGSHLSPADKNDILGKIPADGLEGSAIGGLSGLCLSFGSFALGVTGTGDGRANIEKKILELILNGNAVGDSIDFSRADGEAAAHLDFNLSYGAHLLSTGWGRINWGVNFKYLYGLGYIEVEHAEGFLATNEDGINSQGTVIIKTSEGGSGFGLDCGLSAQSGDNWCFSLGITNLISRINWTKSNKLSTYTFSWDNLTVENSDEDSIITSDELKEDLDEFSAALAPQIAFGAATEYKLLILSMDYKQGLRNLGSISTTPELAIGCEAQLIGFLPLRAGLAVGGESDKKSAIGMGIKIHPLVLDLAYMSTGSLLPIGGKGMGVAVSWGLIF